ncbi:TetR/AcrR family transcriptional regulator [Pseudomonas oryzihabitans]|uniref:TetR/AcrR family transcriptional regulator n=1 Tax=Pseudomonas oryzihabitans TaxID=47885 RepID=UPI0028945E3B|nr:TetR/AcrR family transcriptional regulator [Pseudomonas oryzihabitans]MDT3722251.1 TetR/AcrR family transcriptional regulator [Pseudomonas oryzihabitans]
MKVTKAQAQANRARIVETASYLFRERGYDGVGIAELMAEAGFTHGGFYKNFASKADLLDEAAACGFAQGAMKAEVLDEHGFIRHYLSRTHRDNVRNGCTMAALCTDAARQAGSTKAIFAEGLEGMLKFLATQTSEAEVGEQIGRSRSMNLALIAQVVGGLLLSRACPDDSPLADEILEVCRNAAYESLSMRSGHSDGNR